MHALGYPVDFKRASHQMIRRGKRRVSLCNRPAVAAHMRANAHDLQDHVHLGTSDHHKGDHWCHKLSSHDRLSRCAPHPTATKLAANMSDEAKYDVYTADAREWNLTQGVLAELNKVFVKDRSCGKLATVMRTLGLDDDDLVESVKQLCLGFDGFDGLPQVAQRLRSLSATSKRAPRDLEEYAQVLTDLRTVTRKNMNALAVAVVAKKQTVASFPDDLEQAVATALES